jgi:hypothetical protein
MTLNKYNAKGVYYSPSTQQTYPMRALPDCLFFGSQWEFKVYQCLAYTLTIPGECLILQSELLLKPATAKYPAMTWRCDFEVKPTEKYPFIPGFLVEAKGIPTPQFKRDIQFFEYNYQESFHRLLVVGDHPSEKIDKNIRTITMNDLIFIVRSTIAQNLSKKDAK